MKKGKPTAVLVPIKKWDEVQENLKKLKIMEDLKQSFEEMDMHIKDRLKTPTTAQLLAQL